MEPLLPDLPALWEKAEHCLRSGDDLGRHLSPRTLGAVADAVRNVNCYYSNLIEGHDTRPAAIDLALRNDYSAEPRLRNLQLEALAHIAVQKLIEERLTRSPAEELCSVDWLRWVHYEFYTRLPDEFRWVEDPARGIREPVHPGELRHHDVRVGEHVPPPPAELPAALARFAEGYALGAVSRADGLSLIGAAHHRLLWIHPFGDGNGRVTRLLSDAMLRRLGVKSHGLWSASRGLARSRTRYREMLAAADAPRRNDYDGRGARSLRGLTAFADFFLDICIDQITYMGSVLEVGGLAERMELYARRRAEGLLPPSPETPKAPKRLRPELIRFLKDLIFLGEVPRSEIAERLHVEPRTARRIIADGMAEGVLTSESSRAPVRLALPSWVMEVVLPRMYLVD